MTDAALRLEWSAPEDCPEATELRRRMSEMGGFDLGEGSKPAVASARIFRESAGRWQIHLILEQLGHRIERKVSAASCAELGDIAALWLVTMLERRSGQANQVGSETSPPRSAQAAATAASEKRARGSGEQTSAAVESSQEMVAETSGPAEPQVEGAKPVVFAEQRRGVRQRTKRRVRAENRRPTKAPLAARRKVGFDIAAAFEALGGPMPALAVGPTLVLGLDVLRFRAEAAFGAAWLAAPLVRDVRAKLVRSTQVSGELRACYHVNTRWATWTWPLCLGGDLRVIFAGAREPVIEGAPAPVWIPGLRVGLDSRFRLRRRLRLQLGFYGGLVFRRTNLVVEGIEEPVMRGWLAHFGLRAGLGFALR